VYRWTADGSFIAQVKHTHAAGGFIALGCLNLMALSSSQFVRKKSYRLFSITHFIGAVVFLPSVSYYLGLNCHDVNLPVRSASTTLLASPMLVHPAFFSALIFCFGSCGRAHVQLKLNHSQSSQ
jgi:hypothetical protein